MGQGRARLDRFPEAVDDHSHDVLIRDFCQSAGDKVAIIVDIEVIAKEGKDIVQGVVRISGNHRRTSVEDFRRANQWP